MAQAQGFDKSLNFGESDTGASDRRILSNLIETGIEGDVLLFANNLSDFSEMPSEVFTVDETGLVIISEIGHLPFSDGTEILVMNYTDTASKAESVGGSISSILEVYESNALDRFRLKDPSTGNPVTTGFSGALQSLRRKDVVLFNNLTNLKVTRIPSVDSALGGVTGADTEGDISLFDTFDVTGVYDSVDSSIASLQFAKISIPRTYEDSSFLSKNLVFEGNIRILNTQSINVNDPTNADVAPGLYIKAGDSAKRAFSDTSNPWSEGVDGEVSGALITQANEATIGNMVLYGSVPQFEGAWASSANSSDTGNITDWTHKVPVKINNGASTVFLLVKT